MSTTILHNPRCSKSRQTLELIRSRGIEPQIREYLKDPLTASEIEALLTQLNLSPAALIRRKEPEFKEAGLDQCGKTDADLIEAIARYPKLMERPIVIVENQARIGRPPEQVLEIL